MMSTSNKFKYLEVSDIYISRKNPMLRKYEESTEFLGFDTETYKGACKLICDSDKRVLYNPKSFKECLDFLFYREPDNIHRIFWNMDFDLSAMFKLWNDIEKIDLLIHSEPVEYEGYQLLYFRPKFFQIKKGNKSITFTDFYFMYKMSLNNASKSFLNSQKIDTIDGNKLNTDLSYWLKNRDDIVKYCIQDCILTARLGNYLTEQIREAGLPIPNLMTSHASFSKQYFRSNCRIASNKWIPLNIMDIATQCYYGGRFEVLKRGYFDKLISYDINSAYPDTIAKLPSLKYGKWQKTFNPKRKETIGFYKVLLDIPEAYISAFIVKFKGVCIFPHGKFLTWITWYEWDLLKKYIVKLYYGYEYKPYKREYYPFKNQIDKLYQLKADNKGVNPVFYWIYKIFMNALYGCFIERHKEPDNNTYSGILFNPVYASIITARTRWKLIKDIKKRHRKHILAFHTDSIITDKKMRELKLNKKIGNWDIEESGSGVILMSGIYQIGSKVRNRGFSTRKNTSIKATTKGTPIDWISRLKDNGNKDFMEFKKLKVIKSAESIKRWNDLTKCNTFTEYEKKLRINSDKKRNWNRDFDNCNDVLSGNIDSKTLELKYIRKDTLK